MNKKLFHTLALIGASILGAAGIVMSLVSANG